MIWWVGGACVSHWLLPDCQPTDLPLCRQKAVVYSNSIKVLSVETFLEFILLSFFLPLEFQCIF